MDAVSIDNRNAQNVCVNFDSCNVKHYSSDNFDVSLVQNRIKTLYIIDSRFVITIKH